MRAVVQRVTQASVTVNNSIVGTIGLGLLVLLGIGKCDTSTSADYMIDKLLGLRIFEDHDSKMNFNVREVHSSLSSAMCDGESALPSTMPPVRNKLVLFTNMWLSKFGNRGSIAALESFRQ